jgi:hypothetical protein
MARDLDFLGLDDPHENLDDLDSLASQKSAVGGSIYLFGIRARSIYEGD